MDQLEVDSAEKHGDGGEHSPSYRLELLVHSESGWSVPTIQQAASAWTQPYMEWHLPLQRPFGSSGMFGPQISQLRNTQAIYCNMEMMHDGVCQILDLTW